MTAHDDASATWTGTTAVVTGAASGIGEGIARAAAAAGMTLVLADVNAERLAAVADSIEAQGGRAHPVPTDVTEFASVDDLARFACDEIGSVRLLANNAGVEHLELLWEQPVEAWRRVIDINLHGVYHGIRAFVPRLLATGAPASILNTASIGALSVAPFHASYLVSKHAVLALSECLVTELALANAPITVSVALPAAVDTRIFTDANDGAPDDAAAGQLGQMRELLASKGMAASEAGRIILAQVMAGEFWVATHPDSFCDVATRRSTIFANAMADVERRAGSPSHG